MFPDDGGVFSKFSNLSVALIDAKIRFSPFPFKRSKNRAKRSLIASFSPPSIIKALILSLIN